MYFLSGGTVLAAVLTWFLFEDSAELEPNPSLVGDIFSTLKSPWVWAVAIIVFSCYAIMVLGSYMTPYLTEIMGISAASAAFWATFWNYGCQFLAGPVGGIVGDKIGSRPSVLFIGFILLFMTAVFIYLAPSSASWAGIMIFMFIMIFAAMYAIRGVYFTLIEDLRIPPSVSGAAIGLASVVGFAPDAFMYTWAGNILDTHKGVEGYRILFQASAVLSALGVIVSGIVAFYVIKRNRAEIRNEPSRA